MRKRAVLLVDDERDTRELLARSLERAGFVAVTARSRAEAELAYQRAPFDAVVTDIVLGKDDQGGLGLLTEIRAAGSRVPVIVITAYADVDKLKTALNAGAAYLLEKPFRAPELLAAIERVLDEEAPRAPLDAVMTQARLTAKERAVALLLLEGKTSSEIAALEGNSPQTIRQHVSQIYAKCGVANRSEFFRLAFAR